MKYRLFCLLIMISIIFSGCMVTDNVENNYNSYEKQNGVSEAILISIVDRDTTTLYDMFSSYQKQTVDIDEQIETLFEFCDLSQFEVSNAEYNSEISEQSVRDGRIVFMTLSDIMENIYDNEGKKYTVSYYYILTNEEDPSKEGLVGVTIIREEDNERIDVG